MGIVTEQASGNGCFLKNRQATELEELSNLSNPNSHHLKKKTLKFTGKKIDIISSASQPHTVREPAVCPFVLLPLIFV